MEHLQQSKKGVAKIIPLPDRHSLDEFDEEILGKTEVAIQESDRRELESLYEESMKNIKEGEVITGKIVNISHDYATIDVGFKSEGIIPLEEFPMHGRDLTVGEEIEVLLEKTENNDGEIVLSKEKATRMKIWDDITKNYENEITIEGIVTSRIKGGFSVDVGLKGFLPGSQVDLRPVKNLDKLVGQKLQMKIIKMNRKRGNIVLSRRVILEKERSSSRQTVLANLKEGNVIEGMVKNITD